jgi:DUF917 family protein
MKPWPRPSYSAARFWAAAAGMWPGGLKNAQLAVRMGSPVLISLDELDDDAPVITASAVGVPAAIDKMVRPVDHIRALDQITGLPVSSAELAEVHEVAVLTASRERLILGKGVLLPETLAEAENAIGKPLVDI